MMIRVTSLIAIGAFAVSGPRRPLKAEMTARCSREGLISQDNQAFVGSESVNMSFYLRDVRIDKAAFPRLFLILATSESID
jgi:hypothetical protein